MRAIVDYRGREDGPGTVVQLVPDDEAALYHAGVLAAVPDGAAVGWVTLDGGKSFAAPAAPPVDLAGRARSAWAALLDKGQTFDVAASGAAPVNVLCDGTNDTRADLALLALYGQGNPNGSKTWVDNAGHATVLTGAQLVTLASLAGGWVAATYPALSDLLGRIASGAVTTAAQVDAYPWPTA